MKHVPPPGDGWQPIDTAPKDGREVELWCVHHLAQYSKDPIKDGYAAKVDGRWTHFNGGGWVWHGLCGVHTHWRETEKPQLQKQQGNHNEQHV